MKQRKVLHPQRLRQYCVERVGLRVEQKRPLVSQCRVGYVGIARDGQRLNDPRFYPQLVKDETPPIFPRFPGFGNVGLDESPQVLVEGGSVGIAVGVLVDVVAKVLGQRQGLFLSVIHFSVGEDVAGAGSLEASAAAGPAVVGGCSNGRVAREVHHVHVVEVALLALLALRVGGGCFVAEVAFGAEVSVRRGGAIVGLVEAIELCGGRFVSVGCGAFYYVHWVVGGLRVRRRYRGGCRGG